MTEKSPLEQAQERRLALEAEVERLEREKECLSWNYAQSESLAADLRQERDALQADLNALRAHLNCGLNCACRDCTLNGSEHPCKCESKYCEELDNSQDKLAAAEAALLAADDLVGVLQFPDSVTELHEVLRNRVCLLRHEMRCPDSIKAADNAMNAFSELSCAIFSCGLAARDKAIKKYVEARAIIAAKTDTAKNEVPS